MYAVVWKKFLLDRLADIYVAADVPERERMVAGVERFNADAADDPLAVGESRSDGVRVTFPPLLAITFRVYESDRRVLVVDLKRYGR